MKQANFVFGYKVRTTIIVLVTTKEKYIIVHRQNWMLVHILAFVWPLIVFHLCFHKIFNCWMRNYIKWNLGELIMNLQKGVFHNLLLTSPLEGKEDCILLIETAHSRSGYFWTIPILEVNQYHPWRWFWVGRCGGWAHWSKGCQKWNSTIRFCVQTLCFSQKRCLLYMCIWPDQSYLFFNK